MATLDEALGVRERHNLRVDYLHADVVEAILKLEAELALFRPLGKVVQRAHFILGGISDTTTDCTEKAVRENAERALALLREAEKKLIEGVRELS